VLQKPGRYFHACGWVESSSANILVLRQDDDKRPLIEPGCEWKHPLPVSATQLALWIDMYGMDTKELVVYDSKGSKYGTLHVEISNRWYDENSDYNKDGLSTNERIYRHGSKIVVFYCNHSSSSSPAAAMDYHKWVRQEHPDSRQQVYMLCGGLLSFLNWAEETKQVDKYFIYSSY